MKKLAILLPLTALLSACMGVPKGVTQAKYAKYKAMATPHFTENPQQGYDYIIDITNAPKGFTPVSAYAGYHSKCQSPAFEHITMVGNYGYVPRHNQELAITKINDTHYKITVYDDFIIEEDYFGTGKICQWYKPLVHIKFVPTPNTYNTSYEIYTDSGGNGNAQTDSKGATFVRWYFSKLTYNKDPIAHKNGRASITPLQNTFGGEHRENLASIDVKIVKK